MSDAGIFREFHAVVNPVSDVAAACRWYEDQLGLTTRRVHPSGMITVLDIGASANICLYRPFDDTEQPGYHGSGAFPNFRADDAVAVHDDLCAKGVRCTPVSEGGGIRYFSCFDPDGNRIDVCEYGPEWLD